MDKRKVLILASMLVMATILGGILLPAYSTDDGFPKICKRTPPWIQDLTEDQKEDIRLLVEEMKEDGASREEIKEAVDAQLLEWGIEIPEPQNQPPSPWLSDLTDDQKHQIRQLIETMREDGASPEEIREAVHKQLEEYGIDTSDMQANWTGKGHRGAYRKYLLDQLTEEQRDRLQQKIHEFKESGANRKQIRDMVHAQLVEWGIEVPEH